MQIETHGLDTEKQIFFYEHEFYVLSNFSAFAIEWKGFIYPTSEHVYHSEKFEDEELKELIRNARSAHDALKLAHAHQDEYKYNWDEIKLSIMKEILRTKAIQHPYIMKKLLESGDREFIENSWRDSFWGWGPNKDGKNHMGKLWMELRDEFSKLEQKEFVMNKKNDVVVESLEQAREALQSGKVRFPLNAIPSYVLEKNRRNPILTEKEFDQIIQNALDMSPIHEALLVSEEA